jgi:hypothetical protein
VESEVLRYMVPARCHRRALQRVLYNGVRCCCPSSSLVQRTLLVCALPRVGWSGLRRQRKELGDAAAARTDSEAAPRKRPAEIEVDASGASTRPRR